MHNNKIIILLLLTILILCSCKNESSLDIPNDSLNSYVDPEASSQTDLNKTDSLEEEHTYKNMLSESTDEAIVFWNFDDYDGDEKKEAFAFTGRNYGDDGMSGVLWFVSSNETIMITNQVTLYNKIFILTVNDGTKYICLKNDAENNSLIWGVKDNKASPAPISNVGPHFTVLEDGNTFSIIQSAWDSAELYGAHTRKPYYFYYESGFHEYGGIEINSDDFLKYNGASEALKQIEAEGGVVKSILKRGNNMININYIIKEKTELTTVIWNHNITLKIKNSDVEIIDKNDGVYLPSLVPEIAVYK